MKEERFSDLCSEFLKSSEKRIDEIQDFEEKSDFYVEVEKNKKSVLSSISADAYVVRGFLWILAKYTLLAAGRYLPGSMGGEYCKKECNKKSPDPLALIFAEHATRKQLAYGLHPMRIGDNMPEDMKTKNALYWAQKNKLSGMEKVIQYYTSKEPG